MASAMGLVSGAEVVLEASKLLEPYRDILFLFVGEGQIKDRLEVQARKNNSHLKLEVYVTGYCQRSKALIVVPGGYKYVY